MIPIKHPSKLGIGLVAYLILHSSLAMADFIPFEIRGTPIINDSGTQVEFIIDNPGDKAALGSNDINGATLVSDYPPQHRQVGRCNTLCPREWPGNRPIP